MSKKVWFWIVAGLASALYLCFIFRTGFLEGGRECYTLFDDAMISMRYARNLAEGHGLVFNPGGERVEGYSNLLWTLWMSCVHLLPISECRTSLVVMLSGAIILLLILWMVGKITASLQSRPERPLAAGLAVVLVALYYPLVFWTLRGMEVGLLCLALAVAVRCAFGYLETPDRKWLFGLVLALAVLPQIRDEGLLPAAIVIVYVVWNLERRRSSTIVILVVAVLLPKAVHILFRYFYYGELLPNTYYLKLTGLPILARVGRGVYVLANTIFLDLFPFFVGAALFVKHYVREGLRTAVGTKPLLLLLLILGQLSYSIFVGGDAWEWMNYSNRFVAAVVPFLAILAALYFETILDSGRAFFFNLTLLAALLGVGVLLSGLWLLLGSVRMGVDLPAGRTVIWIPVLLGLLVTVGCWLVARVFRKSVGRGRESESTRLLPVLMVLSMVLFVIVADGRNWVGWVKANAFELDSDIRVSRLGCFLRDGIGEGSRIAVFFSGATPYFSRKPTVDLLGKNDRTVARLPAVGTLPGHNKMDLKLSLGDNPPDVIAHIWGPRDVLRDDLEELGYEKLPNGLFVHRSSGQDREKLGKPGHF